MHVGSKYKTEKFGEIEIVKIEDMPPIIHFQSEETDKIENLHVGELIFDHLQKYSWADITN